MKSWLRRSAVAAMMVVAAAISAAAAETRLEGPQVQGGLIVGRTDPGATILLDGKVVTASPDGIFLLGFGRDAAPTAALRIVHRDGVIDNRALAIGRRDWEIQRIDGLPQRQVTPDPEILKRIRADNALIARVRALESPSAGFLSGFVWPIHGRVSGVFGSQRVLNGEPRSPHRGLDIAAPEGTPVAACAEGAVSLVHPDMFYTGKTVVIDHGHGLNSIYVHMSEIAVETGQSVRKGDIIGKVGRTGRATGAHLHWGIALFDNALDPALLVGPMPGH